MSKVKIRDPRNGTFIDVCDCQIKRRNSSNTGWESILNDGDKIRTPAGGWVEIVCVTPGTISNPYHEIGWGIANTYNKTMHGFGKSFTPSSYLMIVSPRLAYYPLADYKFSFQFDYEIIGMDGKTYQVAYDLPFHQLNYDLNGNFMLPAGYLFFAVPYELLNKSPEYYMLQFQVAQINPWNIGYTEPKFYYQDYRSDLSKQLQTP